MIKRLKLTYMLYNLFFKRQLENNARLYKKMGIKKRYFSPISSADFEGLEEKNFLVPREHFNLEELEIFKTFDDDTRQSVLDFDKNGYCIIKKFANENTVDRINSTIDDLIDSGELKFKYTNKLMFAIRKSKFLNDLWNDKPLLELLNHLMQGKVQLFQSINFHSGSQQKSHSDSIHMTTFPLGGLLGVWLALEDINLDNGPLHYYPGSHKLPYYLNKDYDNVGNRFMIGKHDYSAYESMLDAKIKEQNIEKQVFTAKKGDMLIWHANLIHGGEPHLNKNKTRKSMVMHYFDLNRICYHEITQRPALMSKGV